MSRWGLYDLDDGLKKIAEGQAYTKGMFDLMEKLDFKVKWNDEEAVRAEIALYLQRMIYGES